MAWSIDEAVVRKCCEAADDDDVAQFIRGVAGNVCAEGECGAAAGMAGGFMCDENDTAVPSQSEEVAP